MSFDLKLFQFESQLPFKTLPNNSGYYRVFPRKNPEKKYALKVYIIQNDKQQESVENEIKLHLLASAQHGNVLQVKGSTLTEQHDDFGFLNKKYCILLEEITYTLEDLKNQKLNNKETFSLNEIITILKTMVNVLAYLQKNDIAHRNLHLNAIFSVGNYFKLGEFNESVNTIGQSSSCWHELKTQEKNFINQKHYIDPELQESFLRGDSGAEVNYYKGDVYSLGMIILELTTLEQSNNSQYSQQKLKQKFEQVEKQYGKYLREILQKMLQPTRKKRPDFEELELYIIQIQQEQFQTSQQPNTKIQQQQQQQLLLQQQNQPEQLILPQQNSQVQINLSSINEAQIEDSSSGGSKTTKQIQQSGGSNTNISSKNNSNSQGSSNKSNGQAQNSVNKNSNQLQQLQQQQQQQQQLPIIQKQDFEISNNNVLNENQILKVQQQTLQNLYVQPQQNLKNYNIVDELVTSKFNFYQAEPSSNVDNQINYFNNLQLANKYQTNKINLNEGEEEKMQSQLIQSDISLNDRDMPQNLRQFGQFTEFQSNEFISQVKEDKDYQSASLNNIINFKLKKNQQQVQQQYQNQDNNNNINNNINNDFDNLSCQSYSIQIKDSQHFEQIFGTQNQIPQVKNLNNNLNLSSQQLLMSYDISKKASQNILEELNLSSNKTSYLLTFEQLLNSLKDLQNIQEFELKNLQVDYQNPVGSGAKGDVYSCQSIQDKNFQILKIIQHQDNVQIFEYLHQINFFNSIESNKIQRLEAYFIEQSDKFNSNLFLIFERKKWNLDQILKQQKLKISEKLFIAQQLVEVFTEFQNNGKAVLVHGNIKPSNILLDNQYNLILADFGINQILKQSNNFNDKPVHAVPYAPPELFNSNKIEPQSDIWSLGIIFQELFFTFQISRQAALEYGLYDQEKKMCLNIDQKYIKNPDEEKISALISKMTSFQPPSRISKEQIINEINILKQLTQSHNSNEGTTKKTPVQIQKNQIDIDQLYEVQKNTNLQVIGVNKYGSQTKPNKQIDQNQQQQIQQISSPSNQNLFKTNALRPNSQKNQITIISSKPHQPPVKKKNIVSNTITEKKNNQSLTNTQPELKLIQIKEKKNK